MPACEQSARRGARKPAADRTNGMLSCLRFIIGAILATATLGVSSVGVDATLNLRHQAKAGPIESSRNLVFDDRADWNQFYYADGARRFGELARKPDASVPAETPAVAVARGPEDAAQPVAVQPAAKDQSSERPPDTSARVPQTVT